MSKTSFFRTAACLLQLSMLLVVAAGCGDSGPSNIVSGKVMLGADPVNGTIHFVGADGKEASSPIGPTGGTYSVVDPPTGEVTVLFKGGAIAAAPALQPAPGAMTMPGGTATSKTGMTGVPPPAKYATAAGGIKYTVTSGRQQKDFELTP
jgi:hypothetical protein